MKSTGFFLDKAKQYVSEIDTIISNYIQFDNLSFSDDDPYTIQQKVISELKLKIKLLFSEFDKGEFLVDQIKKVDNNILQSFDEKKRLKSYKSTLELFIDHVNEFRN